MVQDGGLDEDNDDEPDQEELPDPNTNGLPVNHLEGDEFWRGGEESEEGEGGGGEGGGGEGGEGEGGDSLLPSEPTLFYEPGALPNPLNHGEVGAGESGEAGGEKTPEFLEPYLPDNQLGLEEYQDVPQAASPDATLPSPAPIDTLAEPEGKLNQINDPASALNLVHSCARPLRQSHPELIQPIGIEIIDSDDDESSSQFASRIIQFPKFTVVAKFT